MLCGCGNWPLTLKGHGLRISEKRMLRGIIGPEGLEITGDWRKLRSEDLYNT
jgi:hypothetical protein